MRHVILPTQQGTAPSKSLLYIGSYRDGVYTRTPTGLNSVCYSVAFDLSGNLYAGGAFTSAGGVAANRIAKWDGSIYSALGSGFNGACYALAFDISGNLYAGGSFTTAGGTTVNRVAKWDGSSWSALGSGTVGTNGIVYALAFDSSDNLYAGGAFTTAGGTTVNYVAKWDGSSWSALGSGLNGICYAIVKHKGDMHFGGEFTKSDVTILKRVAMYDGNWHSVGDGLSSICRCLTSHNGLLYAGGSFTTNAMNRVGVFDNEWSNIGGYGFNYDCLAIDVGSEGKIFAGGTFTALNSVTIDVAGVFMNNTYVDAADEGAKTRNIVANGVNNSNVKQLTSADGDTLAADILSNHIEVLVFPELEKLNTEAKKIAMADLYGQSLRDFVSEGGILIGCFRECGDVFTFIGVCDVVFAGNIGTSDQLITRVYSDHELTEGVAATFDSMSATSWWSLNDSNIATTVLHTVVSGVTYSVASVRPYEKGYVILIGFDYFESTANSRQILLNALKYRGENRPKAINVGRLATFNSGWHPLGDGVSHPVYDLKVQDSSGIPYFGGAFTAYL